MKEILAVIRVNTIQTTKEALARAGAPSMTANRVMGRGKQKGLHFELHPPTSVRPKDVEEAGKNEPKIIPFIPKRMISLVVPDEDVEKVTQIIIKANQTGNIGDGRIFICPISDATRVRTGEKGDKAL